MDMPRIGEKGQIVLPKSVREALHVVPGDRIAFSVDGMRAILAPVHAKTAAELRGILATDHPVDLKSGRREYQSDLVDKLSRVKSKA